jgi:cytoskeleton protein RodZ
LNSERRVSDMPTLGEELRRLREEKGVSLRQVSDATHIGSRFLQAIESDNYSSLPGGIFNRGFVRSYARYLGMNEEQALLLYNQQLEAQGGEAPRATPRFEGIEEEVGSPWGSVALILLILAILGAGIFTAYRWLRGSAPADAGVIAQQTPTATPAPAASPTASPTASPGGSPAASPAPAAADALRLQVQARDADVWIRVKPDTTSAVQAILKAGESREFVANDKLEMKVGNLPSAIIKLNGRDARLPSQGTSTVSKDVVITKENLQTFVQ